MLKALGLTSVELSIALVSDPVIHELNRDFRHKNKPTDVLAFAMRETVSGAPPTPGSKNKRTEREVLGDVIISLDTAARQASRRRRPLLDEVTMLLAHGLLHLLGYDHQNDAEERVMKAETRRLETAARSRSPST
jgi:probable rRNA maturation factor